MGEVTLHPPAATDRLFRLTVAAIQRALAAHGAEASRLELSPTALHVEWGGPIPQRIGMVCLHRAAELAQALGRPVAYHAGPGRDTRVLHVLPPSRR
jgi:hypothetical protein